MILDSDKVSPNPKDLQVQVYKDVLKPSAQSLGEILSFLPRTIRLFLSGWEKRIWKHVVVGTVWLIIH